MENQPSFRPFPHLEQHFHRCRFLAAGYSAWKVLYGAHRLAATGPYARVRHPQYIAFILSLFGFLLQWPTMLALVMFPILVFMYVRLARREEHDSRDEFGDVYARYMSHRGLM